MRVGEVLISFDDMFCLFRRREHQATERGITSLTPCAEGVEGHPSTSRSTGVPSVATQLQRCAPVSMTQKLHSVDDQCNGCSSLQCFLPIH